ncbi:PIN domain-containing protein [Geodermatophilus sp. DF01-2]|uniref:type II toxin-antitoxin system VapC family toxin n=1 Tax=Geodermatophilus sp. DF01-2 TaxID=2559610 RepID=UPI0010745522|nr:type II toxin-antitoxin system VapC family toxin [Geodermatophilus sp. DF01_2]TFV64791.1 PIN domain-containing protein [Geodermatophilus sp. DF01_2]
MKVVDAGVVVGVLLEAVDPERLGEDGLAAPHLVDSEVTNVLCRLVRRGRLSESQGHAAMVAFTALEVLRFPADWLRPRMWELRDNLTAYDATYVALAESIGATALLTTDARLAQAPGVRCVVRVL